MSLFISYTPKGTIYLKMDIVSFRNEEHLVYQDISEGSVYVRKSTDFEKFEDLGNEIEYHLPELKDEVPCKVKIDGEWKAATWLKSKSKIKDVDM